MKLGCLNHAVLTYQSIISDGLQCIGWVANCPESMPYLQENITELKSLLPVPKLASLSFEKDKDIAARQFDLSILLT
jgi:dethiobiotin synthetase